MLPRAHYACAAQMPAPPSLRTRYSKAIPGTPDAPRYPPCVESTKASINVGASTVGGHHFPVWDTRPACLEIGNKTGELA